MIKPGAQYVHAATKTLVTVESVSFSPFGGNSFVFFRDESDIQQLLKMGENEFTQTFREV